MQETEKMWILSLGLEDSLEDGMATPPVFLPGESHGQRSLVAIAHKVTKSRTWLSELVFMRSKCPILH